MFANDLQVNMKSELQELNWPQGEGSLTMHFPNSETVLLFTNRLRHKLGELGLIIRWR